MHWLIVERYQNWLSDSESDFRYFGLPEYKLKMANKVKEGDYLIAYIATGKSSFSDIRKVESDGVIKIIHQINYDEVFNNGLATSSVLVLPEERWVKITNLLNLLDLTKGLKNWGNVMRTPIRKLSQNDAQIIENAIRKAGKK